MEEPIEPTPITITSKKALIKFVVCTTAEFVQLFYNSQLRIIQHYLFFSILLKPNCCNWVMYGTLDFYYLAKPKFLMLYLLAHLQITRIACLEVGRRNVFFCLRLNIGG